MGLWRIPEKVLLPAEAGGTGAFAFNGRLPTGEQVMAYVRSRTGDTAPVTRPYVRYTAVLFRFDADGVLRSCEFASTTCWDGTDREDVERGYRRARELLSGLVRRAEAEGWAPADILVRPFYVVVDGLATGLVYRTEGEDEGEESESSPEEVRLVPFDRIFHRPWTTGEYDT